MIVTKVDEKKYVGKDIRHIALFRKTDPEPVYNLVYQDGRGGNAMVKRFTVGGTTRDKEYVLTKGNEGSKVLYFSVSENPAEMLHVKLRPKPKLRKTEFDFDLNTIEVKGRGSIGNILSRNLVAKISKGGPGKASPVQMEIGDKTPQPAAGNNKHVAVSKDKKANADKAETKNKKLKTGKAPEAPAKKVPLKSLPAKKPLVKAVKDEPPVTLEWNLSGKEKIQKDRARILTDIEKKAEQKKKAQLKMDM